MAAEAVAVGSVEILKTEAEADVEEAVAAAVVASAAVLAAVVDEK